MENLVFKEVSQINLTPTLALLFGIPIPYSNLGIVIQDFYENEKLEALHTNYLQVGTQYLYFIILCIV